MGILDDAIREHLDLKRRLGAEDEEIHKLESEAFGPPTRPGDPDFADPDAGPEQQAAAPPEALEPPPAPPVAEVAVQPAEPAEEVAEASPAAQEQPDVEEPEPEAPAEGSTALFDHSLEEPESSTPLEPEPEPEPTVPPAAEPPTGTDEQAVLESEPAERPIESFDTVEHHFEGAVEETGEGEVVEGELASEPAQGTDEEDVLEETPEFLRDQPEDDELWFEQGEPKDFDF